ncbi:MAG: NADH-quinone oxidoreductase subunit D [Rectinemataceae bacterium]
MSDSPIAGVEDGASDTIETQEYTLNLGPQHPSTHGVYHAKLRLNGESIVGCENIIGYLHRGMEKLAESRTYAQFAPYTSRFDYLAGALNSWGYALALEKLGGIAVPERAEYLRVIVGELQRIASHLVMVSSMAIDLNAVTGWMYAFTAREGILDLLEAVTGSRMNLNYIVAGGVFEDLPQEFESKVKSTFADLRSRLKDFDRLVSGNEIFLGRTKGVGVIESGQALEYGMTGPNLRASGVGLDLRKDAPYGVYARLDFDVPVLRGGDSFDRYYIRLLEIYQSIALVEQALDGLPSGPIRAKVPKVWKPAAGEVFAQIESARGIQGYHIVSDGSAKPYRLHLRSPTFVNIGVLPEVAPGLTIQDFISTLASLDLVLGEIDR